MTFFQKMQVLFWIFLHEVFHKCEKLSLLIFPNKRCCVFRILLHNNRTIPCLGFCLSLLFLIFFDICGIIYIVRHCILSLDGGVVNGGSLREKSRGRFLGLLRHALGENRGLLRGGFYLTV